MQDKSTQNSKCIRHQHNQTTHKRPVKEKQFGGGQSSIAHSCFIMRRKSHVIWNGNLSWELTFSMCLIETWTDSHILVSVHCSKCWKVSSGAPQHGHLSLSALCFLQLWPTGSQDVIIFVVRARRGQEWVLLAAAIVSLSISAIAVVVVWRRRFNKYFSCAAVH
jgi:hypothetical protein